MIHQELMIPEYEDLHMEILRLVEEPTNGFRVEWSIENGFKVTPIRWGRGSVYEDETVLAELKKTPVSKGDAIGGLAWHISDEQKYLSEGAREQILAILTEELDRLEEELNREREEKRRNPQG